MLSFTCIPVGLIQSNTYIIRDEATRALAMIDTGTFSKTVRAAVEDLGGDLRYILLTHGHFDHIQGAAHAKQAYPMARIAIGELDAPYLRGEIDTMPGRPSFHKSPAQPDWLLRDGDVITLGESALRVIHTPGHTPGGVCFLCPRADRMLFTGDTLFFEEVGRADLPGGDWDALVASVRRLYTIPDSDDLIVLPGHGQETTLAHEKANNPYVRG